MSVSEAFSAPFHCNKTATQEPRVVKLGPCSRSWIFGDHKSDVVHHKLSQAQGWKMSNNKKCRQWKANFSPLSIYSFSKFSSWTQPLLPVSICYRQRVPFLIRGHFTTRSICTFVFQFKIYSENIPFFNRQIWCSLT